MKKRIPIIICILMLLSACSVYMSPQETRNETQLPPETPEAVSAPQPTPAEQPPTQPQEQEPTQETQPQAPQPLYGAMPITLAESTKTIEIRDYTIERDTNMAALKGITFTIRNTGNVPILPRVIMQLSGEGFNVNKIWDYEHLLNGYKFDKNVSLSITLDSPKLMKIIKLTVLDMDQGMKELGSDTKQFIPIPPKK
ncbi:hypothetical protein HY488_02070 [Candidatus Woesearchaeota archaeon]|nr:hypothetical protein [Candidatus Woesearchaeota archaeon]